MRRGAGNLLQAGLHGQKEPWWARKGLPVNAGKRAGPVNVWQQNGIPNLFP